MLKNKSKILVFLIAILLIVSPFSLATTDDAATNNEVESTVAGDNAKTSEEEATTTSEEQQTPEIYDGDLYLFDNNVVMDKLVDGNVFIFGENVEITGRVNGSLFVFADKVTFGENSYIVQSIFACANELTLNGAANDLYAACRKIDMSYDSFMIRDLRVAAETFNFNGGVGRDAFVTANNFNFVTTTDAAAIVYGNLTYSASNELSLSEEFVQGNINYSKFEEDEEKSAQDIILDKVINLCEALCYTIVVFLLAIWLAPKFVEKSSSFIGTKSILAFGIGALASVVAIVVSFALLFSYIGVPLAFGIFTLFALIMSISFAVTTICITYKVKEKFKLEKKYLTWVTLVIVTAILWALKQIPYVGWIISLIIALAGFGVVVLYVFSKNKKEVEIKE